MYYYKRNIGDYASKAGHLTPLEHGVYTLILDAYYSREEALTRAEALRIARARLQDEVTAVDTVLSEFFTEHDGRYFQDRVEEELAAYRAKAKVNRETAIRREQSKRERTTHRASTNSALVGNIIDTTGARNVHETCSKREPNHKPLTINHKEQDQKIYAPSGACAKAKAAKVACPDGVNPQTWADFLAVRKAKRLPMTQSALDGIEREAAKVGMTLAQAIERCAQDGWAGFKASWIERERGERIAAIAGQRHVMPEKSKRRQAIENLEAFANGTYTDPYSATLANADADPWAERSGLLVLGGNTSG